MAINLCAVHKKTDTKYLKQQKLSGRKVSQFDRICENVEKTFVILLP